MAVSETVAGTKRRLIRVSIEIQTIDETGENLEE